MLVRAAYEVARVLGVPWLSRRLAGGAVILCYHNVVKEARREPRDPALHMDLAVFERQMAWVVQHLEPVSLSTLVQRLRNGAPVRDLVALTFDDAYEGFFRSALPVLRSLNMPSAVFVVADAAEQCLPYWWDHPILVARANAQRRHEWLTRERGVASAIFETEGVRAPEGLAGELLPASWATIHRSLGADLTVGAHTCGHPSLPALSATEQRRELEQAADRIQERLGERPSLLAYPYGAWNAAVRDATRAAGYEVALTLEARRIRRGRTDLLALPRVNVPGQITPAAFEAWASGLLPPARSDR